MCIMIGGLIAVSAHRQLMAAPSTLGNRWFRDALFFGLLLMWPVGVFFYLQWPDWSWLYYVDPKSLSETVTFFVWLAYPVATVLGFAMAAAAVRGDSPRFALALPIAGLAGVAVVSAVAFPRFIRLVSYFEYHSTPLPARSLLPYVWTNTTWILAMAGTGVMVGLPLAYLIIRNVREGGRGFLPPAKPE
jgi:hypothetical protein